MTGVCRPPSQESARRRRMHHMPTVHVFVSYSHQDDTWVKEGPYGLIPWLAQQLKRNGVEIWYDHALKQLPGAEYGKLIRSEIDRAHLAILLISQDFVSSDFIQQFELPWIRERVERGELSLVPILVGPTLDEDLDWLADRQMLPGKPAPLGRVHRKHGEMAGGASGHSRGDPRSCPGDCRPLPDGAFDGPRARRVLVSQPPEPRLHVSGCARTEEARALAKRRARASERRRCPEEENACRSHWSGFAGVVGIIAPRGHLRQSPSGARRGNPAAATSVTATPAGKPPRQPGRAPLGRPCRPAGTSAGSGGETACGGARGLQRKGLRAGAEAVRAAGKPGKQRGAVLAWGLLSQRPGSCPGLQQSLLLVPQGGRSGQRGRIK